MSLSKPTPSNPENTTPPNNDDAPPFTPYTPSLPARLAIHTFHALNRLIPWYSLPPFLGALNLALLRLELRQHNLFDTYPSPSFQSTSSHSPLPDPRYLTARHSDGKYNSLDRPHMGCAGMRFGRNFPRSETGRPTEEQLMRPNPRLVSEAFMRRGEGRFKPATTLNLLAAAWIQFMIHDWFNHEEGTERMEVPPPVGGDGWPHGKMELRRTMEDVVLGGEDEKCPGYRNENTAWWDGSQIYGSNEGVTMKLRGEAQDGKLLLDGEGFLPRDKGGDVMTGFNSNWWTGMEMLHTLFAMEHNAICEKLRGEYPDMTGDEIFDKARLVNSALMAKIHTVEWTPAILAHPALQIGMNANWWGIAGEKITKLVGRLSKTSDIISGIPGSGATPDGAPYSLTEEFVSVYRMHSLMPDNIAFFSATSGAHETTIPVPDLMFTHARDPLSKPPAPGGKPLTFADIFYSFGINYPGAITNNNYPDFLRDLTTPDGQKRDLGTVDILRDRERGVRRYCAFRRMLRMSVPKTFVELTGGNETLAKQLEEVYEGDIELVDALVGSHSEPLIPGFGFSETAFRIFILMASRRLSADRFIAGDWNEKTYTKAGFRWVQHTTMKDILARHYPELRETLAKTKGNVFAPWEKLEGSKAYTGVETNAPRA